MLKFYKCSTGVFVSSGASKMVGFRWGWQCHPLFDAFNYKTKNESVHKIGFTVFGLSLFLQFNKEVKTV